MTVVPIIRVVPIVPVVTVLPRRGVRLYRAFGSCRIKVITKSVFALSMAAKMFSIPFAGRLSALLCLITLTGCSSLGLSLYPSGHFLTEQAEAILEQSPRSAVLPRELAMDVEAVHYLQPGEVLLIEPVELDSEVRIAADQKILTDGSVDLGEFGRVIVAGLTPEAAESLIEQTINIAILNRPIDKDDASKEPAEPVRINVRILDQVHRYYVLGEVNSPGSYPLEGNESVLDGILAAGGLTDEASPCKIMLARPTQPNSCRLTLPVCYREITQLGDASTNYQLKPGDRIFVATRSCCEDLLFWRANKTCDRCCKCQTACFDPSAAITGGCPIMRTVAGPILPVMSSMPMQDSVMIESGANVSNATMQGDGMADDGTFAPVEISPSDLPAFDAPTRDQSTRDKSTRDQSTRSQSPKRLPTTPRAQPGVRTVDGELQFEQTPSESPAAIDRFAPMWVQPTKP